MNKLNDTNRANVKVLDESELNQVVGGMGHHRGGNNGGRHGGNGGGQLRRIGGGGGGGGGGRGGNTFNITINVFNF